MAEESTRDDEFTMGVLFVHGIGLQRPGDTLIQCADPLHEYFSALPATKDRVILDRATLRPSEGPAHARLRFAGEPRAWLLAESWWAESFAEAGFTAMTRWATRILPWAMLSHFGANARAAWRRVQSHDDTTPRAVRWMQLAGAWALLVLAPQLALATQVLLGALSVLALVPISGLRAPAAAMARTLAGTLGDSFMLVASATNRAAMVEHIRADLRWLAARTKHVAVVAHSQGAALAWEALLDAPAQVTQYISYGSGLRKLLNLEVASRDRVTSLEMGWTATIAELIVALSAWWLVWPPTGPWPTAFLMILGMAAVLFAGVVPRVAREMRATDRPARWELAVPAVSTGVVAFIVGFALTAPRWPPGVAVVLGMSPIAFGVWSARDVWARFPAGARIASFSVAMVTPALVAALFWLLPNGAFWHAVVILIVATIAAGLAFVDAVTEDLVNWPRVVNAIDVTGIGWRDWFATHDPVPEGALDALNPPSVPVTNQASMVSDHTTYWENRDEFVGDVASALAQCDGWALPPVDVAVKKRRAWRVQFLSFASWAVWSTIAGTLLFRGDWIVEIGRAGMAAAGDAGARVGFRLTTALAWMGDNAHPVVGMALALVPIALARAGYLWLWRRWDARETLRVIRGATFAPEKDPAFTWPPAFLVAALLWVPLPVWLWLLALPFLLVVPGQLSRRFRAQAPPAPVDVP